MESNAAGNKVIVLCQPAVDLTGSAHSGLYLAQGMLRAGYRVHCIFPQNGPIVKKYMDSGCEVHFCELGGWLRAGNTIRATVRLAREALSLKELVGLLRKLKPEIVYANSFVCIRPLFAAKWLRLPTIWHLREAHSNLGGEITPSFLGGMFVARALAKLLADDVIAVSRVTSQLVHGHRSLHIVHNGVPEEMLARTHSKVMARHRMGWPLDPVVIGVPGTIRKMKGHRFLVRAVESLLKQRDSLRIAITGSGQKEDVNELENLISDLGIRDKVWLTGTLDQMQDFYSAIDIACVPSVVDPFPRVVIESMAHGLPVVATKVGGIPEAIRDMQTGLLVDYGDDKALLKAIAWCVDHPSDAEKIGDAARAEVQCNFTNERYVGEVLRLVGRRIGSIRGSCE